MTVDKDLFLYDLAIVAIMKNESPYVKEWLDYHLAAGVNHFYIYDNDSSDNFKEVLQPYINDGTVTYKFYPGYARQCEAYTEAVKNYKFFCRYMAFIDADEFIFPQSKKSVVEVIDDILKDKENIGALGINWRIYGSNHLEKADYSKSVLERFTSRANYDSEFNNHTKTFANPRRLKYFYVSHCAYYFLTCDVINENGEKLLKGPYISPLENPKIILNHYITKSKEEYCRKIDRGNAEVNSPYTMQMFTEQDHNDVFDNSILKYYDLRKRKSKGLTNNINYKKLVATLMKYLEPLTHQKFHSQLFEGKMETFLTCRALASYLKGTAIEEKQGELFERISLEAIYQTLFTNLSITDAQLFLSEFQNFLPLNYPEVKKILQNCPAVVNSVKDVIKFRIQTIGDILCWGDFYHYDNLLRLLNSFENYNKENLS